MRSWPKNWSSFKTRSSTPSLPGTPHHAINGLIGELFAPETMADLQAQGQARGVPIAAVLSPAEALTSDHFRAVGALVDTAIAPGAEGPSGRAICDQRGHAGFVRPAPSRRQCRTHLGETTGSAPTIEPGSHTDRWTACEYSILV